MLVINKSSITTKLITTVSEINVVTSGSTIELFNQSTNVTTVFNLPADSSAYPSRCNEFLITTSTFSALTKSIYSYKIKDSNGFTTETGLLKVVDDIRTEQEEVDSNYVYIEPSEEADDFIVYK